MKFNQDRETKNNDEENEYVQYKERAYLWYQ